MTDVRADFTPSRTSQLLATEAQAVDELEAIRGEIARLGLESHALELDTLGYTIIPPDKAAPAGFVDRARDALLAVMARRDGSVADLADGSTHANQYFPNYFYLLFEDPIFEELLMLPAPLALVTKLLGCSCVLSASTGLVKGPSTRDASGLDIPLHSDSEMHPPPFPMFAQYCNVTWLLTDYTREGGSLCVVPGSHLLCRQPQPHEGLDRVVAVEAPAGSFVIWHGNTWHGAFRKQTPGLRVAIALLFARRYLVTREPYRDDVSRDALDRNDARFAKLMGQHIVAGWRAEGPDYTKVDTHGVPTIYS
jgi:hypothetical protein